MSDAFINNSVLLMPLTGTNNSTVFHDYGRFGLNSSYNNNAKISTSNSKFWYGSSLYLDGTDDQVIMDISSGSVSPFFQLTGTTKTMELWFYEETGSAGMLFCRRSGSASGWAVTSYSFRGVINGAWSDSQLSWARPTMNMWHHIAVVVSSAGSVITVYIDGVQRAQKTSITTIHDSGDTNIRLGANDYLTEADFKGYMNDFRISTNARYTSNFTPPGPLLQNITGRVGPSNVPPYNRTVVGISRLSPVRTYTTTSNATTGIFNLTVPDAETSVVVLSNDVSNYNDVVFRADPDAP